MSQIKISANNNGVINSAPNGVKTRNGFSTKEVHQKEETTQKHQRHSKKVTVPNKAFVERESLLTQMFQVQEFRGLYNIFLVTFLNIVVYCALSDYLRHGEISMGLSNLKKSFGKPLQTFSLLSALHIVTIFSYFPFAVWRQLRGRIFGADIIFTLYKVILILAFVYIPVKIHMEVKFPIASAATIVLEQVRLLMKLYAFYRVNISRGVKGDFNGGSFLQYVYFLYAPTLIYQDSYPRTKDTRWGFVFRNLVELFGCIWFYNVLHTICGYTLLEKFGLEPISPGHLLDAMFFQMIPGGVGFLLGFFVILHTSQNISSEILRFGDRQFYKDWWNSESFSAFYRNWNLPVHGFLYTYIYKETVDLGFRSKFVPAICVFFVSAVVHEYILAFVLGFFFPVLLLFFGGIGATLSFCHRPKVGGNPFIWWSLITGKGLLLFFYSLEYFARVNNCPPAQQSGRVQEQSTRCFKHHRFKAPYNMVMSLVLDFWETLSLSAGCNLFAPRFHLCVSNVQRAHAPTLDTTLAQMRFAEREKTLVPLETALTTTLPKLLLSLTILCLNGLLLLLRRDMQELPATTRCLTRSLLVIYAAIAILTLYAEISVTLFLFWEIRIAEDQGQECLLVNSLLIGLSIGGSLHALSLAVDWSLLPLSQYKRLSRGTVPLWLLALWIPVVITAGLPLTGWKTEFSFCLFLLQFKRNFLRFIGGLHVTALVFSIFLPLFLRLVLRPSRTDIVVHSRWKRKLQKQQRLTIFLVVSFHAICSTPFNAFLLFLPVEIPSPLTLHLLFIPTLVPPLIVPLLLAIRATPPLPTNRIPQNKNPLSMSPFFVDSTRVIQNSKPPGQPHFFSTHYLPMGNQYGRNESRGPSSVHSYATATISSSDSKYGFPLQTTLISSSKRRGGGGGGKRR